uniref:NADH-ubiquinone oxidoreductase chain 3 n=1 Tax=Ibidoecus plataleae TaxID=3004258 RepID=A0A9E9EUD5_9NEOP|nr:NADH dehydrogenase subunit 3 [Ibidoecus plataleae]
MVVVYWALTGSFLVFLLSTVNAFFSSNEMVLASNEPFECGMEMSNKGSSFCIHFFLLGILFLVFDVEVIIIIPMIFSKTYSLLQLFSWLLVSAMLAMGWFIELVMGSMDWKEYFSMGDKITMFTKVSHLSRWV